MGDLDQLSIISMVNLKKTHQNLIKIFHNSYIHTGISLTKSKGVLVKASCTCVHCTSTGSIGVL